MSSHQPDWLLWDRFVAGECSPAEVEQLQGWLDEHPESAIAIGAFREAIDRQAPPTGVPPAWDVERAWARLDNATRGDAPAQYRLPALLRRADTVETVASTPERKLFNLRHMMRPVLAPWLRAAAVLVLVGSSAVFLWRWTSEAAGRVAVAAPPRLITTQRSERADVRLRDGTHVILAPESRLTIPADFGKIRRDVTLVGEGYFEVVHDTMKPFLVYAAHGVVHDLGTRFGVRAYPGDSTVRVVVAEGRVAAGLARSRLPVRGPILTRGDLAQVDTAGAVIITRGVDVDRYESWTEGRLRFVDAPLREVLPEVARWCDLDFEIGDPVVGDRRLTITIRDEPLVQMLDAIAHITDTRYERTGRIIRVIPLPPTSPALKAR